MYKIRFEDFKNQVTEHVIAEPDGLRNIRFNGDKITSTSYFAKEPKRVQFDCFKDDWIAEYILSGEYELYRYVSRFKVLVYELNTLVFTGFIDMSLTEYDLSSNTVKFCCYDYIKLLSIYSDVIRLYDTATGYLPQEIFELTYQGIETSLGITIPRSYENYQVLNIRGENKTFFEISKQDYYPTEDGVIGYRGGAGYNIYNSLIYFKVFVYYWGYDETNENYFSGIKGDWYVIFNNICLYHYWKDIDEYIEGVSESEAVARTNAENLRNQYIGAIQDSVTYAGRKYKLSNANFSLNQQEPIKLNLIGSLNPAYITPQGHFDKGKEAKNLDVLKAVLMLHNLTLVSDANGTIRLANKDAVNNTEIEIAKCDVVEFKVKRSNRSMPNVSTLDILLGDTTVLKTVIQQYYSELLANIWELSISVQNIDKYQINLFDTILVDGLRYRVTEIKKDKYRDENQMICWRLQ